MNDQKLPNGLANFLDSCGMRAPTALPSLADLEALGMHVGIEGAKEIIRLGINGKRNPHRASAIDIFRTTAIRTFRGAAPDEGREAAFNKGVDRGIASQLANPHANIEIRIVKAPAVG